MARAASLAMSKRPQPGDQRLGISADRDLFSSAL
jgi:hypothetical protein